MKPVRDKLNNAITQSLWNINISPARMSKLATTFKLFYIFSATLTHRYVKEAQNADY